MLRTAITILVLFLSSSAIAKPTTEVFRTNATDTMWSEQKVASPSKRHYRHNKQRRQAAPSYRADGGSVIGGKPHGCPARAWCGCWLSAHLGLHRRDLWLARNWARVGSPVSGPTVGAIVVFARGRGGHVGKITAVDGHRIKVLSGNDGRAVRDRWRAARGVIAYRVL